MTRPVTKDLTRSMSFEEWEDLEQEFCFVLKYIQEKFIFKIIQDRELYWTKFILDYC